MPSEEHHAVTLPLAGIDTTDALDMEEAIIEATREYLREDQSPRAKMLANALYNAHRVVRMIVLSTMTAALFTLGAIQ